MITIIIHIGLHRTGTTFLQKEVFEKIKDINYIFDDAIHRIEIKDEINLISNEGLSLSMPHSKTNRIQVLDHLKLLFPNAKIILGFREKKSWLKSCYYRYVLGGGTLKFPEYIEHYKYNILDYESYRKEVEKRFDKIQLYHIDELKLFPRECVRDICKFIGVEAPDFKIVKRNASLNKKQLNTLRLLNNVVPVRPILRFLVVPIIKFIQKAVT